MLTVPRHAGPRTVVPPLRAHWPEYLIEAALLGVFMVSACLVTVLLEHPASPVRGAVPDPGRRLLAGVAMGLTAVALVYSSWGQRSGAHMNPAMTLTFLRLGKIAPRDAAFYVAAQCTGAVAGVGAASVVLGMSLGHPDVQFAVTVPGSLGAGAAFAAELGISFGLMGVVLVATNDVRLAPRTGLLCGLVIAAYVTVEAPVSGMSMNPARTLGSAVHAGVWTHFWIYLVAPLAGMLLAAEAYRLRHGVAAVLCAKLQHAGGPCIFRCAAGEPDAAS